MAFQQTYREAADSVSPGSTTFRFDGSAGTHPYYTDGDQASVEAAILDMVGHTSEPVPLDGTIRRTLPRRHPKYPFLFCSQAVETGYGVPGGEEANPGIGGQSEPIVEVVASYPDVTLLATWEQRPYNVLDDEAIFVESANWIDPDGVSRQVKYATEYLRFTRVRKTYNPQIITAQQGELMFANKDVTAAPHGYGLPGSPRINYPEFALEVVWHQVPYRYVWSRHSYFDSLANYVNHLEMDLENYHFEPGELLYTGYTYSDFWPPFSPASVLDGTAGALAFVKLVDVTLHFQGAYRVATDPPDVLNGNWVTDRGHNVLPSFTDRKFHYVCSFSPDQRDDPNFWHPLFLSAPLQLLWTDPDFPQPDPVILLGSP